LKGVAMEKRGEMDGAKWITLVPSSLKRQPYFIGRARSTGDGQLVNFLDQSAQDGCQELCCLRYSIWSFIGLDGSRGILGEVELWFKRSNQNIILLRLIALIRLTP
jgi:hypothetical protein